MVSQYFSDQQVRMLTPTLGNSKSLNLTFEPLQQAYDQWRTLRSLSPQTTLYHSEPWIDALRMTYGFEFRAAILELGGVARAGALFARVRRPFAKWWVALPFSDACPPLSLEQDAGADLLIQLGQGFGNERFEVRGTTAPRCWQSADHFLSWEIDISGSLPRLYGGLETNFRRNVAKARKSGIGIEHGNSSEIVSRFYRLHQRSRRRLGLPCQPLRFFDVLRQRFGESIDVWLASHQDQDIAAVFLLGDRDTLHYKWSARHSAETSGAGHLLTWSLVEHWVGKFQRLDLGRSDIRNGGLNRFKRGLGGRPTPLPYAFFPTAPHSPRSSEVLSTKRRILTEVWRLLPEPLCRGIERFGYRYLS